MMWNYDRPTHMGLGVGVSMLGMLLILTLLAVLVVLAVRSGPAQAAQGPGGGAEPTRAETLLRERFARGEIDEDDYRSRLDALRSTHPRSP